jgi:hypothetical protein
VWLRADGAGGGGFAECSGMAKALASAALRGIAERDVLADVAFPVEKRHLGVPQLGGADRSDDYGGGGLVLSVLGGGKPSAASEVVGRDGSSPEPNHARRPMSGVPEVQHLEGIVSRRLVASGYPPKILP